MKPRSGYNPKRRLAERGDVTEQMRIELAQRCRYGGNPEHKRNPGDYCLTPPANPRPGKTLCDAAGRIDKADAKRLLKRGFAKGMISVRESKGWPQNVWSVSDSREVFEAQLEVPGEGVYHGYPMPYDDDFRWKILDAWDQR